MSLIENISEELFLGEPIPLSDVCKIYPLTIKEIYGKEGITKQKYHLYLNMLTMCKFDIEDVLEKRGQTMDENISVFEYILLSAQYDQQFFLDFQKALNTFIKEDILISINGKMIIVGNPIDKRIIDEELFYKLQNILRAQNRMYIFETPPIDETDIAKKFREKREKREWVKSHQPVKDTENSITFGTQMANLCVYNIGITPFNIENLTIYTFKELLEKAGAKLAYYTELDMLMAGADSKKIKPENWEKTLYIGG